MKRRAVVCGNNHFEDSNISPLNYAVRDAVDIGERLKSAGFEVDLLLDATDREIAEACRTSVQDLGRDDTFLFFHGTHAVVQNNLHRLFGRDVDASRAADLPGSVCVSDLLGMTNFGGSRVFVIDACRAQWRQGRRAGALMSGAGQLRDLVRRPDVPHTGALAVLSSCDTGSHALEVERLGHGIFSKALLDILDRVLRTDNEELAADSRLLEELTDRMRALSLECGLGGVQRPWVELTGSPPVLIPRDRPVVRGASPVAAEKGLPAHPYHFLRRELAALSTLAAVVLFMLLAPRYLPWFASLRQSTAGEPRATARASLPGRASATQEVDGELRVGMEGADRAAQPVPAHVKQLPATSLAPNSAGQASDELAAPPLAKTSVGASSPQARSSEEERGRMTRSRSVPPVSGPAEVPSSGPLTTATEGGTDGAGAEQGVSPQKPTGGDSRLAANLPGIAPPGSMPSGALRLAGRGMQKAIPSRNVHAPVPAPNTLPCGAAPSPGTVAPEPIITTFDGVTKSVVLVPTGDVRSSVFKLTTTCPAEVFVDEIMDGELAVENLTGCPIEDVILKLPVSATFDFRCSDPQATLDRARGEARWDLRTIASKHTRTVKFRGIPTKAGSTFSCPRVEYDLLPGRSVLPERAVPAPNTLPCGAAPSPGIVAPEPIITTFDGVTKSVMLVPTGDIRSSIVRLTMTNPAEMFVGEIMDGELAVENLTGNPIEDVILTLSVPAIVDFRCSVPHATLARARGQVFWNLGRIAGEQTKTVKYRVMPTKAGSVTCCARVEYNVLPGISLVVDEPK